MGVGADAGAPKGVLGDAGTAGDSERGGMADGRARVPEVLAPAELESVLAGVMGPLPLAPPLKSLGSYPSCSNQRFVRRLARM